MVVSGDTQPSSAQRKSRLWLPMLLAIGITIPVFVEIAGIRLTVYRIVSLLVFLPALLAVFSGKVGKIRFADMGLIIFSAWVALSLSLNHGLTTTYQTSGFITLETLGPYFLARAFIRTPCQFRAVIKALVTAALVLAPFAVYEALTGHNLALDLWSKIGSTNIDYPQRPRLGLDRVQGPFDHPIHFGLIVGTCLGLAYFVLGYGKGWFVRTSLPLLVFSTAFLSLSSGPIAGMAFQIGLILWYSIFRRMEGRWWLLLLLIALAYIAVDIYSTRDPITVAISYLALNARTGLGRIAIFQWGWVNILNQPLLGLGNRDWLRGPYMTPSFDMFWLLFAVRYGLPAQLLLWLSFLSVLLSVITRRKLPPKIDAYRYGWVISMLGLFLCGWMVHFYNAPYILFSFLLGAGVWILDWSDDGSEEKVKIGGTQRVERRSRYTRFSSFSDGVSTKLSGVDSSRSRNTRFGPRSGPAAGRTKRDRDTDD